MSPTVVIYEPNSSHRELLKEGLTESDLNAHFTGNLDEVNQLIEETSPEAVIIDRSGLSGREVELEDTLAGVLMKRGTMVVVRTVTQRDTLPTYAKGSVPGILGADTVIGKPFSIDELSTKVRGLIREFARERKRH